MGLQHEPQLLHLQVGNINLYNDTSRATSNGATIKCSIISSLNNSVITLTKLVNDLFEDFQLGGNSQITLIKPVPQ